MKAFTLAEQDIIDNIIKIHNMYINLDVSHPSDLPEWVTSIHNLQKIMGMRILRREYPDIFPSHPNHTQQ